MGNNCCIFGIEKMTSTPHDSIGVELTNVAAGGNLIKEIITMSIQDIEQAIAKLDKRQLARFRKWFEEYDAKSWDEQFEQDVKAGKLDRLAKQAMAEYKAGKCKEL